MYSQRRKKNEKESRKLMGFMRQHPKSKYRMSCIMMFQSTKDCVYGTGAIPILYSLGV